MIELISNPDGTSSLVRKEADGTITILVHILDKEEIEGGVLGEFLTDYYRDADFYAARKLQQERQVPPTPDDLVQWRKALYERRLERLKLFLSETNNKPIIAHACMLLLESVYGHHDLAIQDWLWNRINRKDWEGEVRQ